MDGRRECGVNVLWGVVKSCAYDAGNVFARCILSKSEKHRMEWLLYHYR